MIHGFAFIQSVCRDKMFSESNDAAHWSVDVSAM